MGCVHPSRHRPTKHYAVVLRPAKHVALNEVLSGEAQAAADKLDIESLSPHVTVGRICSKNEEMLKIKFREMAQKVQVPPIVTFDSLAEEEGDAKLLVTLDPTGETVVRICREILGSEAPGKKAIPLVDGSHVSPEKLKPVYASLQRTFFGTKGVFGRRGKLSHQALGTTRPIGGGDFSHTFTRLELWETPDDVKKDTVVCSRGKLLSTKIVHDDDA